MSSNKIVSILFYVAAAYDFIFGITFFFAAPLLFKAFNVAPPNHWGYVQFPALVLTIFGVMFYQVAQKPEQNRNLIPYGVMLKFSYAGVVLWHWLLNHNMPSIWKPFAVIDLLFLAAMLWAMNVLARQAKALQTY
jgi:hypothetical protein